VKDGWKGEVMAKRAGINRLKFALSELRAKGLRDAITARWGGSLLAVVVRVEMSDEPSSGGLSPSSAPGRRFPRK
jgi:hypothetical protein